MIEKKTQLSETVFSILTQFPYWEYFLQRNFILCTNIDFFRYYSSFKLLDT